MTRTIAPHRLSRRPGLVTLAGLLLVVSPLAAQPDAGQQRREELARSIQYRPGPFLADLGSEAQIQVPAGYLFIPQQDMGKYAELTMNPASSADRGALLPDPDSGESWVIIFSFEKIGYVKDDEKEDLDADAILESLREGTAQANEERRRNGWPALEVTGWEQPPFFDNQTKNLTWCIKGTSEGLDVVNYNSRILGRRGVMSANLIADPNRLQAAVPIYNQLLRGYSFKPGETYAEFREGDKVAAYGLSALIAGGAVAAAAKSGLLGKLIKPIILGVVLLFGAIGAFFKRLLGGGQSAQE